MVAKPEPSPSRRARPDDSSSWLRQNDLRVTRARVAMVDLLRRSPEPLPLGEVHTALGGACDFATVFRFFRLLEEQGLVDKQPWVDGTDRFELKPDATCPGGDGAHDHHHHFLVCRQCQRTEKIEECLVSRLQTGLGKRTGYRDIVHTLQFSGLCPALPAGRDRGARAEASGKAVKQLTDGGAAVPATNRSGRVHPEGVHPAASPPDGVSPICRLRAPVRTHLRGVRRLASFTHHADAPPLRPYRGQTIRNWG